MGFVKSFLFFSFWAALAIFCTKQWLQTKDYVFNAKDIVRITRNHVKHGRSPNETFQLIALDLASAFPGHILPKEDQQWMFVYAGGWKGAMCVIHASVTEYVLFFGTALDTTGHSGRYWLNISDTLISGEYTQWKEGSFHTQIYRAGDEVVHPWGSVTLVHWKPGTWMVEYGRGFLPSALGFTLSDAVFSTQDFTQVFNVLAVYLKALWKELSIDFAEFRSKYIHT